MPRAPSLAFVLLLLLHYIQFSVWRPTIEPLLYLTEFTTVAGYVAAVRLG